MPTPTLTGIVGQDGCAAAINLIGHNQSLFTHERSVMRTLTTRRSAHIQHPQPFALSTNSLRKDITGELRARLLHIIRTSMEHRIKRKRRTLRKRITMLAPRHTISSPRRARQLHGVKTNGRGWLRSQSFAQVRSLLVAQLLAHTLNKGFG